MIHVGVDEVRIMAASSLLMVGGWNYFSFYQRLKRDDQRNLDIRPPSGAAIFALFYRRFGFTAVTRMYLPVLAGLAILCAPLLLEILRA